MIRFGTGGWRAIIADEFTKSNIPLSQVSSKLLLGAGDNLADARALQLAQEIGQYRGGVNSPCTGEESIL